MYTTCRTPNSFPSRINCARPRTEWEEEAVVTGIGLALSSKKPTPRTIRSWCLFEWYLEDLVLTIGPNVARTGERNQRTLSELEWHSDQPLSCTFKWQGHISSLLPNYAERRWLNEGTALTWGLTVQHAYLAFVIPIRALILVLRYFARSNLPTPTRRAQQGLWVRVSTSGTMPPKMDKAGAVRRTRMNDNNLLKA